MTKPLSGYTVFEMGSALAGPYCGRILADLGARVVKVEPPETGEAARSWGGKILNDAGAFFHAVNRGKDSLVVDFTDPDQVENLKSLIAQHGDAVFQNLRPDVTRKTGLTHEDCRALNPELVYCNISAFGPDGPLANEAGYEVLAQAFTGIIDVTGDADGPPSRVGFSANDVGTAMWAALGILAALLRREKTRQGGVVDTSIFDTAMGWQTMGVSILKSTGQAPKRSGLKGPLLSPNRAFACSDGLMMITAGTDAQFAKLCGALGCPDVAQDARYATNAARMENDDALHAMLESLFRTDTRANWWAKLQAAKVPGAPILSLDETLAHEHTIASGVIQNAPDGAPPSVALPLRMDGERPAYERSAPALGVGSEDLIGKKD